MRVSLIALVTLGALALNACVQGPPRRGPPTAVINRALTAAPGAAQPSAIVKTELAYGRAGRETGQYAAGLEYAAPGALLHRAGGAEPLAAQSGRFAYPEKAGEWGPRTVVMSCDGALALTKGRFRDAEGLVGNYVTAWARQRDNSYKWLYEVAGHDIPQPPPREEFEDGAIVVTAIDSILGLVATCPRGGADVPPPPPMPIGEDGSADAQLSSDGTLRWQWEHRTDGTRFVKAEYFYEGAWQTAIEESLASLPEG